MDDQQLVPLKEAAGLLQVSPRWLADQCRQCKVPHVKLGGKRSFTREQIARIIAAHTVAAQLTDRELALQAMRDRRDRRRRRAQGT